MMHHENINCERCKKPLGLALTTTMASSVKVVVWLECENCDHVTRIVWTSNNNFGQDPNQLEMFEGSKNL